MMTTIIQIDEYGNVYFDATDFDMANFSLGDALLMRIGEKKFEIPFYSGPYCKVKEPALIRKKDKIFLSIRHGCAIKEYSLGIGQCVTFSLLSSKKYWEKENAYSFEEITDKSTYGTDEEFANFRPILPHGGHFYRSSSPVDNAYNRASSVISCIEKYKVSTIIDIADSQEELDNLINVLDNEIRSIIYTRRIFAIGDDSGLYSQKFSESVAIAIRLIISAKIPCLIHCRAGKRRSGFVCAIIQALYGMSADQIMEDYMLSYKNNNKITYSDNPKRYEYLKNDTIKAILHYINGTDLCHLRETTKQYLIRIGLSSEEILLLKQKICQ